MTHAIFITLFCLLVHHYNGALVNEVLGRAELTPGKWKK